MQLSRPVTDVGAWFGSVLRGFMNYYAVPGNIDSIDDSRTQQDSGLRALRAQESKTFPAVEPFLPVFGSISSQKSHRASSS